MMTVGVVPGSSTEVESRVVGGDPISLLWWFPRVGGECGGQVVQRLLRGPRQDPGTRPGGVCGRNNPVSTSRPLWSRTRSEPQKLVRQWGRSIPSSSRDPNGDWRAMVVPPGVDRSNHLTSRTLVPQDFRRPDATDVTGRTTVFSSPVPSGPLVPTGLEHLPSTLGGRVDRRVQGSLPFSDGLARDGVPLIGTCIGNTWHRGAEWSGCGLSGTPDG